MGAKVTDEKKLKASATVAKGAEVRTKSQTPEALADKKKAEGEESSAYAIAKAEGPEAVAAYLANYKKLTGNDYATKCAEAEAKLESKTATAEVIDVPTTDVTKVKKSKKGLVKRLSQEKKALTAEEIKANVDAAASREAKVTDEKKLKASATVAKGAE